jgi:hypothetical protein
VVAHCSQSPYRICSRIWSQCPSTEVDSANSTTLLGSVSAYGYYHDIDNTPEMYSDDRDTIEADPDLDQSDGYVSDSSSTASDSLASSVRDYVFENNRRYHKFKEGQYLLPNDEPEQEREDMKHAMIVHVCDGRLHFAPLEQPQKILDLGTGTGIWAIDSEKPLLASHSLHSF